MEIVGGTTLGAVTAFIGVGAFGVLISIMRIANPVEILPTDIRSEPWFYPVTSAVGIAVSLFFITVGVVRLIRDRRRH